MSNLVLTLLNKVTNIISSRVTLIARLIHCSADDMPIEEHYRHEVAN